MFKNKIPFFQCLCLQYITKLDFNAFVQIINLCLHNNYIKFGKLFKYKFIYYSMYV